MSAAFDVYTPDGNKHRHIESMQNGSLEFHTLDDGSIAVVGVHESRAVRSWGGVSRPASRREEVLATYPPGSEVKQVAW
jgi:hypothetical protein